MTEKLLVDRLFDWRGLSFTKRYENPRLSQFIQTQPCLIPGCTAKSTVSHSTGKGRGGNKASDALALHLCLDHHTEFEHTPFVEFERKYKINLVKALVKLHERYFDYCEGLITGEITVVEHRKHYKSVRKPSLAPLNKTCNTPQDFSKYQPTTK